MGLLSKWVESLDYDYEILSTCTHHRSPRSTCDKCLVSCEEQAISMFKGKPVIENSKCIECGNCISACPVQAVAGIYPKRTIIQNQLVTNSENVPTVKELLVLYKKGVKAIIAETSSLLEGWKAKIDEANVVLSLLGELPFIISVKVVAEDEYYSRRELFSLWKKESKSAIKQVAPARWRFNHDDFDLPKYYKDYQFTRMTVNLETCTLCKACEKLCNKNCIEIKEDTFTISTQECSSCQLCVDICPEQGILVENRISMIADSVFPIYQKVCSSCQKTYKTLRNYDEKCVICTKRKSFFK